MVEPTTIHVLLIDDDQKYCVLLQEYLEPYSFKLTTVGNGTDGIDTAVSGHFKIILLDMFLPDMNGIDVLRAIRQTSQVSVVVLSAHNEEMDRIVALELGADDYVPKAFSPRELLARLRAVLRRSSALSPSADADVELGAGGLTLDTRTMTAALNGIPLVLTNIEFQLLYRMVKEPGRVFSREHLLSLVRDRDFYPFDRSIDMHISSLRRKLNDDSKKPTYVKTVRGVGYCFMYPRGE
jgi:two-component system response regulator CpxR